MKQERLRTLVARRYGEYIDAPGDFRVNCPYCPRAGLKPDNDHKLYISWSRELYHCFRCDAAGPISKIFEDEVVSIEQQRVEMLERRKEEFQKEVSERNIELIPDGSIAFSTLENDHPAFRYILGRGVKVPVELLYHPAYTRRREDGHHRYLGPRLIFPVYMNGRYEGFQARTIENHPVKYVNAEGFMKSHVIYNWDRVKRSDTLVVTEGIFDVLNAGMDRTVAIFGKSLSKFQTDLILYHGYSKIVFALDKDAVKKARKAAAELSKYHGNVWYLKMPWSDPGSAPSQEFNNLIDSGLSPWRTVGLQKA
jgi:hypothetical protein